MKTAENRGGADSVALANPMATQHWRDVRTIGNAPTASTAACTPPQNQLNHRPANVPVGFVSYVRLAASTLATNRIWLPGTRKRSLNPPGAWQILPNVCSRHGSQPTFQYADRVIVQNGVAKSQVHCVRRFSGRASAAYDDARREPAAACSSCEAF